MRLEEFLLENRYGNDCIASMTVSSGAAVPPDLAILNGLTAGVACIDAAGQVIYANQQWRTWLGSVAPSWFEWPWESPHSEAAFASALMQQALTQGQAAFHARLRAVQAPLQLQCTLTRLDGGGAPTLLLLANDFTSLPEQLQQRTGSIRPERQAFVDATTGLPNRRALLDRLAWAVEDSRQRGSFCALLFIDLDHFKNLNDSQGHRHGDRLLSEVGKRLMTCVRSGDMVARFGGDEFVILVEHLGHERQEAMAHVQSVVDHLILRLRQPFDLFGHWYYTTPSVGVAVFGDDEVPDVEELLKRVDMAMYEAKSAGRNTQRFFDPQMQLVVNARASMEADLRHALARGELCVHYQPVTNQQGALLGAEALVRWMHPVQGMIGPTAFIELAEQTGLIVELGRFVMRTACEQLALWALQPATASLTISVNVSPRQFRHPMFVDEVLALIESTQIDPHRLKLELTENLLLGDLAETVQRMRELKAKGVGFALDDFGVGYSSLRYLKALPLDQLKVDRSFVNDVPGDPNGAAIVQAILTLAQSLHMEALAEGVESAAQVEFLSSHGCTRFQGFHFGHPMSIEDFEGSPLFKKAGTLH